MGKIFLSLGFWMTIVLFVALGYAFDRAWGSECAGSINCGYTNATRASSISPVSWISPDENEHFQFENDLGASDDVRRRRCTPNTSPRTDYPDFQQMANLQAGDSPMYAPGFSLNITRRPPEVALCPGPIEIPRH
ncbi:hypothetical protein [Candidatus Binatus sp.]|uniref:hypothetical protein n=1 Tax=Candidatus Binatus sp. TaxID=2811406 RepID=UPI003BAEA000